MQYSQFRHQKTTSNLFRITLKRQILVSNEKSLVRVKNIDGSDKGETLYNNIFLPFCIDQAHKLVLCKESVNWKKLLVHVDVMKTYY